MCQRSSKLADFAMGGPNDCLQNFKPKCDPCCAARNYKVTQTTCPSPCQDCGCNQPPPCSCYPAKQACIACCCDAGCDGPSKRLINIDAMEELVYFNQKEKNDCGCDMFNVCEQCGTMTKYRSDDADDECTPVKYSRRQRFVFRDKNNYPPPCLPAWTFQGEAASCYTNESCSKPSACGQGLCRRTGLKNCCNLNDTLPNKTGVYYFNKTDKRLVLQTKQCVTDEASVAKEKQFRHLANAVDNEVGCDKPPVIIQPLTCPPPPCPNPFLGCFNPFCGPCGPCSVGTCGPGGPVGPCGSCGPCCGGGGCCGPCGCRPGCGNCCCNPWGGCCCNVSGNDGCGGGNGGGGRGGGGGGNGFNFPGASAPAPPPPPPQATVIPMCIPINPPMPPPPCPPPNVGPFPNSMPVMRRKKRNSRRYDETIVELSGNGYDDSTPSGRQSGSYGKNVYRCEMDPCCNGMGKVLIDGKPCCMSSCYG